MIEFAYIRGWYPPARCSIPFGNCSSGNSDTEPLIAMHNILIAHAMAVDTYRRVFWVRNSVIACKHCLTSFGLTYKHK